MSRGRERLKDGGWGAELAWHGKRMAWRAHGTVSAPHGMAIAWRCSHGSSSCLPCHAVQASPLNPTLSRLTQHVQAQLQRLGAQDARGMQARQVAHLLLAGRGAARVLARLG